MKTRKRYCLFLDEGLIESLQLKHETDSIEAYIERLITADQHGIKPEESIPRKVLTYLRSSLGYPNDN